MICLQTQEATTHDQAHVNAATELKVEFTIQQHELSTYLSIHYFMLICGAVASKRHTEVPRQGRAEPHGRPCVHAPLSVLRT